MSGHLEVVRFRQMSQFQALRDATQPQYIGLNDTDGIPRHEFTECPHRIFPFPAGYGNVSAGGDAPITVKVVLVDRPFHPKDVEVLNFSADRDSLKWSPALVGIQHKNDVVPERFPAALTRSTSCLREHAWRQGFVKTRD